MVDAFSSLGQIRVTVYVKSSWIWCVIKSVIEQNATGFCCIKMSVWISEVLEAPQYLSTKSRTQWFQQWMQSLKYTEIDALFDWIAFFSVSICHLTINTIPGLLKPLISDQPHNMHARPHFHSLSVVIYNKPILVWNACLWLTRIYFYNDVYFN